MMRSLSPRAMRRREPNEIEITLHADEWTPDVPLPPESRIAYMGEYHEHPFHPSWRFVLEEKQTREILVGYYVVPMAFDATISWFQSQMNDLGWESGPKEGYKLDDQALLRFQHPDTHAQVEISIQWWPYRHQSTAMIRREQVHPYEKIEIDVDKLIAETPDTPELAVVETQS